MRQVAWKCLHHLRSGLISMPSAWCLICWNFYPIDIIFQPCKAMFKDVKHLNLSEIVTIWVPKWALSTPPSHFYHTMTQFTRPCTTSYQITSMGTHRRLFLTKLTRKHFSNRHILYSILKVIWWHTTTMLWQQIIVQRRVRISSICVNLSIWQFRSSLLIRTFLISFTDYYGYQVKQVSLSQDPSSKRYHWPSKQASVSKRDWPSVILTYFFMVSVMSVVL